MTNDNGTDRDTGHSRELRVILPLDCNEVEPLRRTLAVQALFPRDVRNYADAIAERVSKPEASPEDGEELGRLLAGLKADADAAEAARLAVVPILARAWISDPDERGRLQ